MTNQILYEFAAEVTNRFKGLDLENSVLEELWTEVCNTVQEAVNKTIPKKKKSKKSKWLSEETLQIAEEWRELKSKGEREKYIQLNAEFQRLSGRDKKAFFNEHCLIIEENNPPDILWIHWRVYNFIVNTSKWVLFLPPSDAYVRSFLYLLYTLIKLYYTHTKKRRRIKQQKGED